MKLFQRGIRALLLVVLVSIPTALFAQDDVIAVSGSGLAHPLFTALADEAEINYDLNVTGTDDGFTQFCIGEATIVNTTRAINVSEEALCEESGVEFIELLAGYDVLAFISNGDLTFGQCFDGTAINAFLAPSAVDTDTWDFIFGEDTDSTELNVFLPGADSITYVLLDQQVNGLGFRSDAEIVADDAAVIAAVEETAGGFGVVRLGSIPEDSTVNVIQVRNQQIGQCVSPSATSIGNGSYIAGTAVYSYINMADVAAVSSYIELVQNEDAVETITSAGYTGLTAADREINAEAVVEPGRQFSRSITEFQIPPTVTGTVNLGGAAGIYNLLNASSTNFSQQYQNVTVNVNIEGEPVGLRRLCNGEIDFAVTYGPLSEETQQNCEAIDIEVFEVNLGPQVAVLVANEADEHLACMTTEQIAATWAATGEELPTNWQAVDDSFPDQDFILFAGNDIGNRIPNLMLQIAGANGAPLREDTETNSDVLYRAAAVANVEGALTYMNWDDYQNVLDNDQERIQLVSVDAGDGCVEPTEETIVSGEYPLARDIRLAISMSALERPEVQSFLWYIFSDQRFSEFARVDLDLLTLRDLADIRQTLQDAYGMANEAALVSAAEASAAAATEEAAEPEAATEEAE